MSPELYREYPGPNEADAIGRLLEVTLRTLKQKYLTGPQLRDTHAKGLAVAHGTFTIDPNLPPDLQVGLFKTARSYRCLCRFSNTDPNPKPDISNDMRAVSIKLFDVEGEMLWSDDPEAKTLDFTMMTAPAFMTPDIESFIQLQDHLLKAYMTGLRGNLGLIWFFMSNPATAIRVVQSEIKCANLLELPYFSETAYRFGDKAVKYKLTPHKRQTSRLPGAGAPFNFLNERLREDLATADQTFDFMLHFQVDPVKMPIEDSAVVWSEELSAPRKVATLTLHQQAIEAPGLVTTGEHLSFTPWRTLPEHRPLGWTNRARLKIYQEISKFRHERNAVAVREPRV